MTDKRIWTKRLIVLRQNQALEWRYELADGRNDLRVHRNWPRLASRVSRGDFIMSGRLSFGPRRTRQCPNKSALLSRDAHAATY